MDTNKEGSSTRPSLAFMVGSILVTLAFLVATVLFLCCYHWAKIMNRSVEDDDDEHAMAGSSDDEGEPGKNAVIIVKIDQVSHDLPVVFMPGDEIPTFVAVPCPRVSLQRDQLACSVAKACDLASSKA